MDELGALPFSDTSFLYQGGTSTFASCEPVIQGDIFDVEDLPVKQLSCSTLVCTFLDMHRIILLIQLHGQMLNIHPRLQIFYKVNMRTVSQMLQFCWDILSLYTVLSQVVLSDKDASYPW